MIVHEIQLYDVREFYMKCKSQEMQGVFIIFMPNNCQRITSNATIILLSFISLKFLFYALFGAFASTKIFIWYSKQNYFYKLI